MKSPVRIIHLVFKTQAEQRMDYGETLLRAPSLLWSKVDIANGNVLMITSTLHATRKAFRLGKPNVVTC